MVRPIDSGGELLYILHGEDDFSIVQFLGEIKRGLGDPSGRKAPGYYPGAAGALRSQGPTPTEEDG
jgi:hypothetical protein